MAKSQFEKQIEKQMKQEKQLADKKRREEARMERKAIIRERASSIVNGSSIIDEFVSWIRRQKKFCVAFLIIIHKVEVECVLLMIFFLIMFKCL